VFFVSAVFHELAVGVPLHMVRFWAFAGIMLQVGFGFFWGGDAGCVPKGGGLLNVRMTSYAH
jgi:hypothetical protein